MKKKLARRARKHVAARPKKTVATRYFVATQSWMFLVAFALMLGLGAVVGNFVSEQLNQTTPQVAGASVEK